MLVPIVAQVSDVAHGSLFRLRLLKNSVILNDIFLYNLFNMCHILKQTIVNVRIYNILTDAETIATVRFFIERCMHLTEKCFNH